MLYYMNAVSSNTIQNRIALCQRIRSLVPAIPSEFTCCNKQSALYNRCTHRLYKQGVISILYILFNCLATIFCNCNAACRECLVEINHLVFRLLTCIRSICCLEFLKYFIRAVYKIYRNLTRHINCLVHGRIHKQHAACTAHIIERS